MKAKRGELTACIISALIMVWLLISFIEVVSHNLEPEYVYSPLNAFKLFVELFKEVRG